MTKRIIISIYILAIPFYSLFPMALFARGKASLTIKSSQLLTEDTLELRVWDDYIANPYDNGHTTILAVNDGQTWQFKIDMDSEHAWVSLHFSFQKINRVPAYAVMDMYLISSGDSVVIDLQPKLGSFRGGSYEGMEPIIFDNWSFGFSGKGFERYVLRNRIDSMINSYRFRIKSGDNSMDPFERKIAALSVIEKEIQEMIYCNQDLDNDFVRHLLWLEAKGEIGRLQYREILSPMYTVNQSKERKSNPEEVFKDHMRYLFEGMPFASMSVAYRSPKFVEFLTLNAEIEAYIRKNKVDLEEVYAHEKNAIPDKKLKERVLTSLLIKRFKFTPIPSVLDDLVSFAENPISQKALNNLKNLIDGTVAYAFSLPDLKGDNIYRLEDFVDKVVFIDFWYLGCAPCVSYMIDILNPVIEKYRNNDNVVFLTIGVDSKEKLDKMDSISGFLSPDAIHLYTEDQRFDHPILQHYAVNAYPFPILIDGKGRIHKTGNALKSFDGLSHAIEELLPE